MSKGTESLFKFAVTTDPSVSSAVDWSIGAGATRLWGWQSWVGGRMFCVGKWAWYVAEDE